MKFKNKIKAILLFTIGLSLVSLSSCEDFLEENPKSIISPSNFPASAEDANLILGGISDAVSSTDFASFSLPMVVDLPSDETVVRYTSGDRYALDQFEYVTANGHIENVYQICYQVINQANLMISSLPADKDFSKPYIAAAKFYRAWMYSYLVRIYGPAIIRDQPTEVINNNEIIIRSSEEEVYNFIVKDLEEAEIDLPLKWTTTDKLDDGRPTKGAAKMLLAEMYLSMAGEPINDSTKWALALNKAQEIIDLNHYALVDNYSDLFLIANKNGTEHILTAQMPEQDGLLSALYYPAGGGVSPGGFYIFQASSELFNEFPDNDDRKAGSFASEVENPNGSIISYTSFAYNRAFDPTPAIKKYLDFGRDNILENGRRSSLGLPIFRYAEAYLIKAEAENEVNGPTMSAIESINTLRRRANADELSSGLSKEELRDIIQFEWSLELAFELKRRFNLLRWGQIDDVLLNDERSKTGYASFKKYFPIPQSEFDSGLDPKLQNPGY